MAYNALSLKVRLTIPLKPEFFRVSFFAISLIANSLLESFLDLRVKYLAKEHNAANPDRAGTRISRSGVHGQRVDHRAFNENNKVKTIHCGGSVPYVSRRTLRYIVNSNIKNVLPVHLAGV